MFGASFNLLDFIFSLVALIVAIDIHEFSHAWAAERLGDPTPRLQGRLTLNPLAHLDPIGTILLILVRFGWGKPVQFDPFNLRNPRRDGALISIAGPVSNMLMTAMCSILLQLIFRIPAPGSLVIMVAGALLQQIIVMNVMLGIFNLVPIHPLDGFKIVEGILPEAQAHEWHELERFGIIFLIFLLFPIFGGVAPIQRIISPVINFFLTIFLPK
ncbi:MAG: site-2 protease family protein [Candidatus Gottesmanbacteria bacterium]|nr:site-2 protease family protein [Candidatus Gottesmanbacteria bacterium]